MQLPSDILPRMLSADHPPNEYRATDALSFSELLKHLSGVHVAAGSAINDDYLFHFSHVYSSSGC